MLNQKFYTQRRQKLLASIDNGVIIIPSFPLKLMSNDVHYKYRQHTELLYYVGYPEPDTIAILEKNNELTQFLLFVPKRDPEFEIWNGKRYGVDGAVHEFNADKAYETEEFESELLPILKRNETVYYMSGIDEKIDQIVEKTISVAINSRDKIGSGPINLINPINIFHHQRVVKTEEEIELIEKSAKISADAMTNAMEVTKPGVFEYQIEGLINYHYFKNGAERCAYPAIVGGGVNATILHYITNQDKLNEGELLLIDAGAEYMGYAADITRTWPINGKFTEPQKEIYSLVLNTLETCTKMVKPGIQFKELSKIAISMLTEGLIKLGLLTGDRDELIENAAFKRFYMHRLGHWLGIDTHDTGQVVIDEAVLREGHYFTIEPGIYIPTDEDIPEKYRGIGVRIEDDILVTNDAYRVLTKNVVKSIDEIEKIVGTKELP